MVLCQRHDNNQHEYEYDNDQYQYHHDINKYKYLDFDLNVDVDQHYNNLITMICKQTYAIPGIWQITSESTTKQLAGSCEISSLKLIASGSAAHVKLYDSNGVADSMSFKWALDASTTANDSHDFANPLNFEKGVYAVCEQGAVFNPLLCLAKVTPK